MTPDLSGVFEDFVILYKAVFGRFTWVDAGSRGRTRSEGEGGVNRPIRAAVAVRSSGLILSCVSGSNYNFGLRFILSTLAFTESQKQQYYFPPCSPVS